MSRLTDEQVSMATRTANSAEFDETIVSLPFGTLRALLADREALIAENAKLRRGLVPEGFVIVPEEPTEKMIEAAKAQDANGNYITYATAYEHWDAMLEAYEKETMK